jgi:foldase protein PrsA
VFSLDKVKLAIIYYSSTGTNYQMAKWAEEAAKEAGAEVRVLKVKELAPPQAIDSNPAWRKHYDETQDVPEATSQDLEWADALIFSMPTRFGVMPSQLKSELLDQLVMEKLINQKAKEAGFEVTEETLEEARLELEEIIANLADQMEIIDSETEEGQEEDQDKKDYTAEAKAYVEEELAAMGQTQDEFIDFLAQQMAIEAYIESLLEDVEANEDEIEEYYNERLESQKSNIVSIDYDEVELYKPEEVRVKHVLIGLSQEDMEKYDQLIGEGKDKEAKEHLEEKLKEIEPRAMEVLEKAQNGEDFEKLIEEYGEDAGMKDNSVGYIVRRDGDFVPEFEEAALNLKEGEISDLVSTDFGYHIIKFYERYPQKIFTLEEKRDELKEYLDYEKKADAWAVILDEWMKEADIKKHENKL